MQFKISNNNKPMMALLLCASLSTLFMGIRIIITGNFTYIFLLWNLFLAFVPLGLSWLFKRMVKTSTNTIGKFLLLFTFGFWLLFFPNAPYIITDMVHLTNSYTQKFWYDLILIYLFAFSGISAGMYSLYWIHQGVHQLFGQWTGWVVVVISAFMAGYGVYLGRILRWNSWDILSDPFYIVYHAANQLTDHTAIVITVSFALMMSCTYAVFISLLQYKQEPYERI